MVVPPPRSLPLDTAHHILLKYHIKHTCINNEICLKEKHKNEVPVASHKGLAMLSVDVFFVVSLKSCADNSQVAGDLRHR